MASRKAKERARLEKVLQQRRQRQPPTSTASVLDDRVKLTEFKPRPAVAERLEDAAVFARVSREQLSSELQAEAILVAESLELVHRGSFEQAVESLKSIARSSPYADWRLFVRGLVGFYNEDPETATQNWFRLDRDRRPARIASTLLHAEMETQVSNELNPPTAKMIETAHELRFRPNLIESAKRIAAVHHRGKDTTFSVSQVAMLSSLRDRFRSLDKDFISAFSCDCVRIAFFQPNSNVFKMLTKPIAGPAEDPNWNLLTFQYLRLFQGRNEEARKSGMNFINSDLPKLNHLTSETKNALVSSVYLVFAGLELESSNPFAAMGMFRFLYDEPNYKQAENYIQTAIQKFPANRNAYEMLIDTLEKQLNVRGITKRGEELVEVEIIAAKVGLVKAFPSEVETSLWLIDHYFDEERLDLADELIKKLSDQRLDDPLAKALPWKLKIREAMRLGHRKDGIAAANSILNSAESIWPNWLAKDWLPFLKAALVLRAGDRARFEQLVLEARQNCGANEVVGNVMAFAAMQQMGLPSNELKSMREIVDGYVREAERLPIAELCSIGSFFWDLTRMGLRHKGYRIHSSRFGKAMTSRLKDGEMPEMNAKFVDTCCWTAEHRFWKSNYDPNQPDWIAPLMQSDPKVASAVLGSLLKERYSIRRLTELKPLVAMVLEAARSEKDAYYRFRFEKIATDAKARIVDYEGQNSRTRGNRFGSMVDDSENEDDEEDDCMCESCRARRAREQEPQAAVNDASSASSTRIDRPSKEYEDDEIEEVEDELGIEDWENDEYNDEDDDDDEDEDDENDSDGFDEDGNAIPSPLPPRVLTLEEKKARRKQLQKELNRKLSSRRNKGKKS